MNDFRSSAASSSAAAGDASVGASAATDYQEDMLALRLQQGAAQVSRIAKRVGRDHLGVFSLQFRARIEPFALRCM